MAYLSWISDEKLTWAFNNLIASVNQGKHQVESRFDRNVIDPFSALFSMELFDLTPEEWKKSEIQRQIDKSLTNAIGTFHQQILSSITGWEDLHNDNQVDLVNHSAKIIAELKNKHNTLNAASAIKLYEKLFDLVNSKSSMFKGFTSYYVQIIPKNASGINECFYPSDNASGERSKRDEKIRVIDGRRFYALASNKDSALDELFHVAPKVLFDLHIRMKQKLDVAFVNSIFKKAFIE